MKRKCFKSIMILCIMAILCVSAFAASAQVSSGGHTTAFFTQTVSNKVYINQTAAGWNGTTGTMRWVLAKSGTNGSALDSDYITGAGHTTLKPGSSQSCKLTGYNDESFKLAVVYSYTIS